MSKKALKLALEALEAMQSYAAAERKGLRICDEAITVLREELAEQPAQPTTTENNGGKTGWPPGLLQDDCKGLSKWLSNKPDAKRRVREALDKMAENARELGLDYEPAPQEPLRVAKIGQRIPGPDLLPPSVWRYQLRRIAWWFILGILGMLWLAFLVACAAYSS